MTTEQPIFAQDHDGYVRADIVAIGALISLLGMVGTYIIGQQDARIDERAECEKRIEAMQPEAEATPPQPNLMMQKLKCVDRDLKAYGAPCIAWRRKV
jgi:hypothetical protein